MFPSHFLFPNFKPHHSPQFDSVHRILNSPRYSCLLGAKKRAIYWIVHLILELKKKFCNGRYDLLREKKKLSLCKFRVPFWFTVRSKPVELNGPGASRLKGDLHESITGGQVLVHLHAENSLLGSPRGRRFFFVAIVKRCL